MKNYLVCILVFISVGEVIAQDYKYQIGIDGGYTKPLFYLDEAWGKSTPDFNFNIGIQLQDHLNKRWQFDYGLFYKSIAYRRTGTFSTSDTEIFRIEDISSSFIELPFTVRYKVLKDSKFKFLPGLGVRPTLSIVEQTITSTGNESFENISKNQFGFGAFLSLALEYQLNEKWKFRLDPVYTYRLPFWGDFSTNFGIYRSITDKRIQSDKELNEEKETFNRNAISLTAGYGIVIGSFQVGYERIFWEKKNSMHQAVYGKLNIGRFVSFKDHFFGSILGGYLIGKKHNFLDVSLGALVTDSSLVLPSGAIGYRYQKNNIQFRTGVGFIEGAYVGLARTF